MFSQLQIRCVVHSATQLLNVVRLVEVDPSPHVNTASLTEGVRAWDDLARAMRDMGCGSEWGDHDRSIGCDFLNDAVARIWELCFVPNAFQPQELEHAIRILVRELSTLDALGAGLSQRKLAILDSLLEGRAFDEVSRIKAAVIARKVDGNRPVADSFKQPLSELVEARILYSKDGRGGGYWLTENGMRLAQSLKKR